jgi:hypothetical protein
VTDREKCAELLAIVKELKGENRDIYYFLSATFAFHEDIAFKDFVDELLDETLSYARGLWA